MFEASRKIKDLKDGSVCEINADVPITLKAEHDYLIEFSSNTKANENTMALMLTKASDAAGTVFYGSDRLEEHISMKIFARSRVLTLGQRSLQ